MFLHCTLGRVKSLVHAVHLNTKGKEVTQVIVFSKNISFIK